MTSLPCLPFFSSALTLLIVSAVKLCFFEYSPTLPGVVIVPVGLVSAAGYLVLGGSIISAVSQTAVKSEEEPEPKIEQTKE